MKALAHKNILSQSTQWISDS